MKDNLEYTQMAYLYDKFYENKNYNKEVEFIENYIKDKNSLILDAGCGTGSHAKILYDKGYNVFGFDLNEQMIEIANSKIENRFTTGNLLSYNDDRKYDLIISFFAVFNHLRSYHQFKKALKNLKNILNTKGVIIIDLHNPQSNGRKIDTISGATRIMQWKRCRQFHREYTDITYFVDGKKYMSRHIFKIFNISKVEKIAKSLGFSDFKAYGQYNIDTPATPRSKNIQIVLTL